MNLAAPASTKSKHPVLQETLAVRVSSQLEHVTNIIKHLTTKDNKQTKSTSTTKAIKDQRSPFQIPNPNPNSPLPGNQETSETNRVIRKAPELGSSSKCKGGCGASGSTSVAIKCYRTVILKKSLIERCQCLWLLSVFETSPNLIKDLGFEHFSDWKSEVSSFACRFFWCLFAVLNHLPVFHWMKNAVLLQIALIWSPSQAVETKDKLSVKQASKYHHQWMSCQVYTNRSFLANVVCKKSRNSKSSHGRLWEPLQLSKIMQRDVEGPLPVSATCMFGVWRPWSKAQKMPSLRFGRTQKKVSSDRQTKMSEILVSTHNPSLLHHTTSITKSFWRGSFPLKTSTPTSWQQGLRTPFWGMGWSHSLHPWLKGAFSLQCWVAVPVHLPVTQPILKVPVLPFLCDTCLNIFDHFRMFNMDNLQERFQKEKHEDRLKTL